MTTDLTAEFFAGFDMGGDCFALGNPHIPTSSSHEAFEAGRFASWSWRRDWIKQVRPSRGSSVRIIFHAGDDAIIRIDHDHQQIGSV